MDDYPESKRLNIINLQLKTEEQSAIIMCTIDKINIKW